MFQKSSKCISYYVSLALIKWNTEYAKCCRSRREIDRLEKTLPKKDIHSKLHR